MDIPETRELTLTPDATANDATAFVMALTWKYSLHSPSETWQAARTRFTQRELDGYKRAAKLLDDAGRLG